MRLGSWTLLAGAHVFASLGGLPAREATVWQEGHGDLAINRIGNAWRFGVVMDAFPGIEFAPEEVVIQLTADARLEIPDLPAFKFLGEPDEPIWIAPQGQLAGMPYLGLSSESTPSGTFEDNRFHVLLTSLAGPGGFVMWTNGSTDTPEIHMDSRDGFSPVEGYDLPSGGHNHMNWGFTKPGTYRVGLSARGIRSGESEPIVSEETHYQFEAGVLKFGEADIDVALEAGELKLSVRDEATGAESEPAHVALHAGPSSWRPVPLDPAFSFLRNPSGGVYLFPQNRSNEVLFLGLASERIDVGTLRDDCVRVRLVEIEGPGDFYYYEVDAQGHPTVRFNSADGLSGADTVRVSSESRVHRNWAFTAPGFYRLTFVASGVLDAGEAIMSRPETFLFEVFAPDFLDHGDIDLTVTFDDENLEFELQDEATGRKRCLSDAVLVGGGLAMTTAPEDEAFRFLGAPGSATHVLPQADVDGVLRLGVSGARIDSGMFAGEDVQLQLVDVTGPGRFALYSTDRPNLPTLFMNSADGIDENDIFPVPTNGRSSVNWAFSAPGWYQVRVRAVGLMAADNAPAASQTATLSFVIRPGRKVLFPSVVGDGSRLRLDWASEITRHYQLRSRTRLGAGAWVNEGEPVSGTGGTLSLTVPITDERFRVFQLLEAP